MVATRTGDNAPDFTAIDAAGRRIRLADYAGKKHVVLVFNRGFS
jgi:peroxiredoxin